ncbi:hypothetical protein [Gaoshiqia sediminis]|uniref:DUF3168 domain-containing protein n=1 Tax=Gaoshiqia sediminis TaxID=2986998 RepID=A0AA41Y9J5_9BACT|nr:hypothetical protein [Gaoshiqia sediminis]MCW0484659.1 hypothetical protein [Gaoshiqia sediminis]
MFSIGNKIKEELLSNTNITTLVGTNIFNLIVVTNEKNPINPPYIVIEIDSISPNRTKDHYIFDDISFSVIIIASKYNDLVTISEAIKTALEYKNIQSDNKLIETILFDSYRENFNIDFQVYNSKLTFTSKVITL